MSLLKCKAGDILVNEQTLELTILGNPDSLLDDTEKYIYYRPLDDGDYIINKQSLNILQYSNDIKTAIRRHISDFRLASHEEVELFKSGKNLDMGMYILIGERKCKKCSTMREVDLLSEKFTAPAARKKLHELIQLKPTDTFRLCEKCETITVWEFISFNFRNIDNKELLIIK